MSYWDTSDGTDGYGVGVVASLEAGQGVYIDLRFAWFEDLAEGDGSTDVTDIDLEVMPIEIGVSMGRSVGDSLELYLGGGLGSRRRRT